MLTWGQWGCGEFITQFYRMASLEARTFQHFYSRLVTDIQHSILTVANDALSEFLLTPEELQECLKDSLSNNQKATTLLETIGSRVEVNPSDLGKFINILKRDASRDDLVEQIGKNTKLI